MTQAIDPQFRPQDLVEIERQHGAHNYHPLDVVIEIVLSRPWQPA
jgi:hypothetical protein